MTGLNRIDALNVVGRNAAGAAPPPAIYRPVSINGTKSRVKPRVADEAPLALGSRRE